MVRRLLKIFNREFGGLHEAALLLALSMFMSQLLALARDRLLAGTFGASTTLDIYYSAFRLPDLLYATLASFVSVAVLIPFLVERLENGEEQTARNFLSAVFSLFMLVMISVGAVAWIFMPELAPWLAPGFDSGAQTQMIEMARILLLSPILLGLSNLLGSVTQVYRKFFVYSLSPIFYNVGIIVGIVFFVPILGPRGLVWGVILGALLHLFVQLPTLWSIGFWPRWSPKQLISNIRPIGRMIMTSWPRTLTLSTSQLVILIFIALASYLGRGSIAIFNFAYNLQSVPLSIVGISYSVAAFPTLSKYFARGHLDKFIGQITSATRHIIFWSMPATVMFIVLRAQIIRVVLGTGRFDWTATRLTAACLALFAISVLAQSLILLLIRGYYASGQTAKPLFMNIFSSILMVGGVFAFSAWWQAGSPFRLFWENILRVGDLPNTSVLILPLAYSLGTVINCLLLAIFFAWEHKFSVWPVLKTFNQALWSAAAGGVVAYYLLNVLSFYLPLRTLTGIFLQGLSAGVGGLVVNLLLLWLLGSQELKELVRAIRHKFWQSETLVPEQSEL
ncbi:MAG: lipid II flippase MurJ [Candidatus Paceibacterota bacterium]|jgi:putative peptidoglycan lipid II flippase